MRLLSIMFLLVAVTVVSFTASAHTIRPAVATVVVGDDGQLDVQIRMNVEAVLADIGPEYTDTNDSPNAPVYDRLRLLESVELASKFEDDAESILGRTLLSVAGETVPLTLVGVNVAEVDDVELARDSVVLLAGQLPAGSEGLQWSWPADYGSSVIRFGTGGSDSLQTQWLQPGDASEVYAIAEGAEAPSRLSVVANYIRIGFEHILPKGLDHILFVVGIFLLSAHLRPLLLQVTAFTVAHTITLGLSIYGVISLPSVFVETLIALSIAYVGFENCISPKLKPWRIVLVFVFGLLHGMGFAGVLSEIGLPQSEFITGLISFNVGVELGQLAVIGLCLLLFGWARNRSWYRAVIVIPLSSLITVIGLYWAWERAFG